MAGDWLPMKDVANPPDVNNFHDMLIINRDLTSFFCNPGDWLWGGGNGVWHAGYPLVTLTIAGKEYPATECRWCPYRALRRNSNCAGFEVQTDTRMINEQRAVLVRVEIINPDTTGRSTELTLSVPGDLQTDGISVLNAKQRKGFVTAVCPATKPDAVTNDNGIVRWRWNLSLPPEGSSKIEFVSGDGDAADAPQSPNRCDALECEFLKGIRRLQAMLGATLGRRLHAGQSPFLRQLAGAGHGQRGAEA